MPGNTFTEYIRKLTRTNVVTLPTADIVTFANVEQGFLAEQIASNVDEGYFNVIDERTLEAGVRNYTYPPDFLKGLRYVSADLDGWQYLKEIDFGYYEGRNLPLLEESFIIQEFAQKPAHYIISGNELWLLSGKAIETVPAGLKIIAEVYPENLTTDDLTGTDDLSIASSNVSCRLPRAAYRVLAKKVSIAYKSSKDKPLPLTEDERRLDVDLQDLYEVLRGRNSVRVIQASVPYNDGQQY